MDDNKVNYSEMYFKLQSEHNAKTDNILSDIYDAVKKSNLEVKELQVDAKNCPREKVSALDKQVQELAINQKNCPIVKVVDETELVRVLVKNIKTLKTIIGIIAGFLGSAQIATFFLLLKNKI